MKVEVGIIILNWNGMQDSLKCLESLTKITKEEFDSEIYVIDNDSSDNSVQAIKNKFPNVDLLVNSENLGYSGGNNVGINKALGRGVDYILLLNNDTIVAPTFLDELVKFSKNHKEVGIIGPVLKFKKGFEVFYDLGGKINKFIGRTSHNKVSLLTGELPREADYLSGACLLIKKQVFATLGVLEPSYFFGFEDVELCLKAREKGFKIYIVPTALVEHLISSSIGATSPLKTYYLLRNNLLFVYRNFSLPFTISSYLYLAVLSVKIFINSPRNLNSLKDAWWDFLRGKTGKKSS